MHHGGTSDPLSIARPNAHRKGGQRSDGRSEGGSNAGRGRHPSRGCEQALRRHDGGGRPHAVDTARELLRDARPVRLRQDHDAADDRRVRGPDRRPRVPRRLGRHRAPALQARRQHRLPVLRAVPAPDASRRTSRSASSARRSARPRRASAPTTRSSSSSSATWPSASPPSSPAASSSASRSPARSSTARARCCSTSRSARSTCGCASSSRSSSSGSSRTSASPSCT